MPVLRVSQTMVKPFTSSGISDKAFSTCAYGKGGKKGGRQGGTEKRKSCAFIIR